ncbi:MAG: 3'-5' exonuclease domain-containing protein 2 [Burkholderiaceae bacterium]|nr:3'-5' exonuclease domain-containing protein 2 [Burkholderiaceae bacterium]
MPDAQDHNTDTDNDSDPHAHAGPPGLTPLPSKEEMLLLEPFGRIGLEKIHVVSTRQAAQQAMTELEGLRVLGFDTESKPTFLKGEVSDGPHVVQFATSGRAWVFQLHDPACREAVAGLLASTHVTKVGFGLAGDRTQIMAKFGVPPEAVMDLDNAFRKMGYRKSVGVKTAIALIFNKRFLKSKKVATTNWANARLTELQVLYAANDAWAAIRVYEALDIL